MAIALSSAERGVRIRVIAWEAGPLGRGLGNRQRETRGQQGGEPPPGHWSASHEDRCLVHGPKA